MKTRFVLLAAVLVLFAAPAWADSTGWNFDSITGTQGQSQIYSSNGIDITAYGFSSAGTATDLYGKRNGGNENGLGISGLADYEIGGSSFIQLYLVPAEDALHNPQFDLAIGSVQPDEGYAIYGSNAIGSLGSLLLTGNLDETFFAVNGAGKYSFLSIRATTGNVLVSSLSAKSTATPEPTSLALFGAGLTLLGVRISRRMKSGIVKN
jgi:hypothetical protein